MFYAHVFLSKKGPLAKVWLAAHWDKKLTKAHVFETDVAATVGNIIAPQVKMALRTSGHLLLGVVRIYSRKQKYLIQDLGEACAKIRMAFRPGVINLPAEGGAVTSETITLPEIFHGFETAVADLNAFDMEEQFTLHRSRADEITMADDMPSSNGMFAFEDELRTLDNDFGEMVEDFEPEMFRRASSIADQSNQLPSALSITQEDQEKDSSVINQRLSLEEPNGLVDQNFLEDGFGPGDLGFDANIATLPGLADINLDENAMEVDQQAPTNNQVNESVADTVQNASMRSDPEGFSLEPVDISGMRRRPKRKRKLLVDTAIELTADTIRANLSDPTDTLQPKCFPPPTKKSLLWREAANCEQLFIRPTLPFMVASCAKLITRNFSSQIPRNVANNSVIDLEETPEMARLADGNSTTANASVRDVPSLDPLDQPASPGVDQELMADGRPDELQQMELGVDDLAEEPTSKLIPDLPDLEGTESVPATQSTDDQQQSGEMSEEFERHRWTKRTQQVLKMVDRGFAQQDVISLKNLTQRCNRKQAAARFYTCLLLAKEGAIKVSQETHYGDISVEKGSRYAEAF